AYSRLARFAAWVSSWLFRVACCFAGSICIRGVPAAPRAPGRPRISRIFPPPSGRTTDEARDFSVATYSVLSGTFRERATSILTATPAGPWGPPAEPLQPAEHTT